MPFGSLYNVLHGETGIVVDQDQALRFALDIAKGMEFLHSMDPLIQNLNLNSKHVMVKFLYTLKRIIYYSYFFPKFVKKISRKYRSCGFWRLVFAQIDEDLAKININDPKYKSDDRVNGVNALHQFKTSVVSSLTVRFEQVSKR